MDVIVGVKVSPWVVCLAQGVAHFGLYFSVPLNVTWRVSCRGQGKAGKSWGKSIYLWIKEQNVITVVQLLSHVQFFATSWTVTHQASLPLTIDSGSRLDVNSRLTLKYQWSMLHSSDSGAHHDCENHA